MTSRRCRTRSSSQTSRPSRNTEVEATHPEHPKGDICLLLEECMDAGAEVAETAVHSLAPRVEE